MARTTAWLLVAALACAVGDVRAQPTPRDATAPVSDTKPDAGAVALLPLDADKSLEIYGQPVASEVARALVVGSIDVVVVGPKMTVPERAKLIVDGKIAGVAKSTAVTLTIRVRKASDGVVLETVEATAPTLSNIDRAAAEISARVLPVVRGELAKLVEKPVVRAPRPEAPASSTPGAGLGITFGASSWQITARGDQRLVAAMRSAISGWYGRVPGNAIEVDVKGFRVERGAVPLARARVHLKVRLGTKTTFDRTVVTDTVVGERGMTVDDLAASVAREVLAIARPHVVRGAAR